MPFRFHIWRRFLRRASGRHLAQTRTLIKYIEQSPTTLQAIAKMDAAAHFMTHRPYSSANPALAAVQAPLVAGLWMILILSGVILIWGMLAPIDSAAIAHGKVVLLSNKKTVQHLEGGIIKEILVKEGDVVQAHQPLVQLDDTTATANRDVIQGQLYVARASEARLIAERDGLDTIPFDEELLERSKQDESVAKALNAQQLIFDAMREGHRAKLSMYDQRIAQSKKQMEGFDAQGMSADDQIALLAEEINTVKQMVEKGLATRTRLYDLQRRFSELQGSSGQYAAEIGKEQQMIQETTLAIVNERNEFLTKNSQDLRDAQAEVAELDEKLRAANDIVKRTTITAPVGGIVTGLKFHTLGGIIDPGKPIMDIVPQNDQLVIEAQVKPTDIDVVYAGLDAQVVFTAYKMRTTPKAPAKVTQISADSFSDDRNPQREPFYLAHIEVDKTFLQRLDEHVKLYPGMPADVLIRTGSRSFFGYLFKPITDSMHRAFREE